VPYSVPMAGNSRENLLAINWTIGSHNSPGWKDFFWKVNQPLPSESESIVTQADVVEKWMNTKEFHSKVCWHCFPHLNNGVIKPPIKFVW
jgi:hypothetical protein